MTVFLDRVRSKLNCKCLVKRGLNKNGCKISMANAPSLRLVVDFDKPGSPLPSNSTRCDYLVIAEDARGSGLIMPLELKRGSLDAGQVIKQLQAGAQAAEGLVPIGGSVSFLPVVASGSIKKHERIRLRKRGTIRFREHYKPVRRISCGARLVDAIDAIKDK